MSGTTPPAVPEAITRDELADYLESVNGQRRDRALDLADGAFSYALRNREASLLLAADRALPTRDGQPGALTGTDEREALGRLVHEVRRAWIAAHPGKFFAAPWEERDPGQRELDMRIGAAVAAAERARLAARMDDLAAYYPESVWPPDSDVRDSIGATAMRHAYKNAAREIREAGDG